MKRIINHLRFSYNKIRAYIFNARIVQDCNHTILTYILNIGSEAVLKISSWFSYSAVLQLLLIAQKLNWSIWAHDMHVDMEEPWYF